jgi:hypothetical protein
MASARQIGRSRPHRIPAAFHRVNAEAIFVLDGEGIARERSRWTIYDGEAVD